MSGSNPQDLGKGGLAACAVITARPTADGS
jgi:uncharacterized OsmC-like protein